MPCPPPGATSHAGAPRDFDYAGGIPLILLLPTMPASPRTRAPTSVDRIADGLNIAQASRATGVSAKAIREYEALCLIPPVPRRGTGAYRVFSPRHLDAIRLIRQAQALGFTLREIRALGREDCSPDWPRIRAAAAEKRHALDAEQQRLQARQQALDAFERQLGALLGAGDTVDVGAALRSPPPVRAVADHRRPGTVRRRQA